MAVQAVLAEYVLVGAAAGGGTPIVGLAGMEGRGMTLLAVEQFLPCVVVGTYAGLWLARRTRPERFRKLAWAALGALGVALLIGA